LAALMDQRSFDERMMRAAIAEARRALAHDDVPVGAVVVFADRPEVASGHNRRESDRDPTAHAEILALRDGARIAGAWMLVGASLYVTQEPCPMCAGAIVNARIARVIYGCGNPKAGALRTLYRIADDPRLNHRATVEGGVLAAECGALLSEFFKQLRSPIPDS
jgi:tRNA(adenine34) deaminase